MIFWNASSNFQGKKSQITDLINNQVNQPLNFKEYLFCLLQPP
uniref:Uncharacterized protein n=1 Tax=Arundo donax TaxID=35708 RepID=A0A0A9EL96_ARUDO